MEKSRRKQLSSWLRKSLPGLKFSPSRFKQLKPYISSSKFSSEDQIYLRYKFYQILHRNIKNQSTSSLQSSNINSLSSGFSSQSFQSHASSFNSKQSSPSQIPKNFQDKPSEPVKFTSDLIPKVSLPIPNSIFQPSPQFVHSDVPMKTTEPPSYLSIELLDVNNKDKHVPINVSTSSSPINGFQILPKSSSPVDSSEQARNEIVIPCRKVQLSISSLVNAEIEISEDNKKYNDWCWKILKIQANAEFFRNFSLFDLTELYCDGHCVPGPNSKGYARVTDKNGLELLNYFEFPDWEVITHKGFFCVECRSTDVPNQQINYAEILACNLALRIGLMVRSKVLYIDSVTSNAWSSGRISKSIKDPKKLEVCQYAATLRKKFEESKSNVYVISGDINKADFGYH